MKRSRPVWWVGAAMATGLVLGGCGGDQGVSGGGAGGGTGATTVASTDTTSDGGSAASGGAGGSTATGGAIVAGGSGGSTSTGGSGGATSTGGSGGATITGGAGGATSTGGAGGATSTGGSGGCASAADCDDGLFCNGAEACVAGVCTSGGAPCDDGLGCTIDACDEGADSCSHTATDALCDNGIACDGAETCSAILGCLSGAPQSCSDGVDCTDDFCDLGSGQCKHVANDNLCQNGAFCDGIESCDMVAGCLSGTPVDCSDGIACTADACNEATDSCDHVAQNAACNDGNFCNGAEVCVVGLGCQGGAPPSCDDGLSCTIDACDAAAGSCVHTANNAACNDGLACDGVETCSLNGAPPTGCVQGAPIPCAPDAIPCTADACDEATQQCKHTPNNGACPNGQLCIPQAGGCTAAPPCQSAADCDDGNKCNGIETCNGVCQPGQPVVCNDGVDCTIDSCNPATGACVFTPNNAVCDDGFNCDGIETCDPNAPAGTVGCQTGQAVDCNDGVDCTADACIEPAGTCVFTPIDANCSDGQLCNGMEKCDPVMGCKPAGAPFTCPSDGIACTTEVCDPQQNACISVPHDNLCPCGQTCNAAQGGCGSFCAVSACQGKVYACGDCLDNDGDCQIDSADTMCLGPCDNTEDSFFGGIPGQNNSPCKSDCYFDQDTGSGNDDCYWSHKCDPLEIAPGYPPEGSQCAYNPNTNIPGFGGTCAQAFATQSATCGSYCGPLTPNGCDCFGCCAIPGAPTTVWLGSENPAGVGSCNLNTLNDPTKCKPCTQVAACLNTCAHCEICIGKPDLPPDCQAVECGDGVQRCGLPGLDPCAAGFTCITGCCQANPN